MFSTQVLRGAPCDAADYPHFYNLPPPYIPSVVSCLLTQNVGRGSGENLPITSRFFRGKEPKTHPRFWGFFFSPFGYVDLGRGGHDGAARTGRGGGDE